MLDIEEARQNLNDAIQAHCRSGYDSLAYRNALRALICGAPCVLATTGHHNAAALVAAALINDGHSFRDHCAGYVHGAAWGHPVERLFSDILDNLVGVNAPGRALLDAIRSHYEPQRPPQPEPIPAPRAKRRVPLTDYVEAA